MIGKAARNSGLNLAIGRVFGFSFTLLFLSTLFQSCRTETTQAEQIPVARVGNTFLYLSEVSGIIPDYLGKEDSIATAKAYIDNWVTRMLKLSQASLNLPIQQKLDIEKRVEEYRSSLQIFAYEQQFVREKMDTAVSENEVEEYYQGNPDAFLLQQNIVKGFYIQVPRNAPDIDDLRRWLNSGSARFDDEIGRYVATFSTNHQSFEGEFIYFNEVLNRLQNDIPDQESFLKSKKLIELSDSLSSHFISITDYKLKGSATPFSLAKEDIRKIILNKRQVTLLRELDRDIFLEGQEKKQFELFSE